jgi:hypothetical protein
MVSGHQFVEWLASTPGSIALHESTYAYTAVEGTHVLTLCVFAGLTAMVDLRLIGISFRAVPVSEMMNRLLPWMIGGFVLMVITGALLFYAIPVRTYENVFARAKLLFLILAGINVWLFHSGIYLRMNEWGQDPIPPKRARIAGTCSIFLWTAIIIAGRMIAYDWFDDLFK